MMQTACLIKETLTCFSFNAEPTQIYRFLRSRHLLEVRKCPLQTCYPDTILADILTTQSGIHERETEFKKKVILCLIATESWI